MLALVIAVGRLKAGPERELCQRYGERFGHIMKSCGVQELKLVEIAESPSRRAEDRQAEEARAILAALPQGALIVALDERGTSMSSPHFAELIARTRQAGAPAIAFVIGGPDGLAEAVRARAGSTLSFGGLTMPHQIVRVLLLEQLYRAATILAGHPYHRS